jgi:hypothetical protein
VGPRHNFQSLTLLLGIQIIIYRGCSGEWLFPPGGPKKSSPGGSSREAGRAGRHERAVRQQRRPRVPDVAGPRVVPQHDPVAPAPALVGG